MKKKLDLLLIVFLAAGLFSVTAFAKGTGEVSKKKLSSKCGAVSGDAVSDSQDIQVGALDDVFTPVKSDKSKKSKATDASDEVAPTPNVTVISE